MSAFPTYYSTVDHPSNNGKDGFIEERRTDFIQILTGPQQMQTCNYFKSVIRTKSSKYNNVLAKNSYILIW